MLGDDAILRALAVDPDARGAGYGWMLADMAVADPASFTALVEVARLALPEDLGTAAA